MFTERLLFTHAFDLCMFFLPFTVFLGFVAYEIATSTEVTEWPMYLVHLNIWFAYLKKEMKDL